MKKGTKKTKKVEYQAKLKVLGRFVSAKGGSIEEAITNLKAEGAKGMSILTLTRGSKSRERVLPHVMTAGVFGQVSPTIKAIRLKQLVSRFDV